MLISVLSSCLEKPVPNDKVQIIETTFKGKYSAVDKNGITISNTEVDSMSCTIIGSLVGSINFGGGTDTIIILTPPQLNFSVTEYQIKVKLSNRFRYSFDMDAFTRRYGDLIWDRNFSNPDNLNVVLGETNEINVRFKDY